MKLIRHAYVENQNKINDLRDRRRGGKNGTDIFFARSQPFLLASFFSIAQQKVDFQVKYYLSDFFGCVSMVHLFIHLINFTSK